MTRSLDGAVLVVAAATALLMGAVGAFTVDRLDPFREVKSTPRAAESGLATPAAAAAQPVHHVAPRRCEDARHLAETLESLGVKYAASARPPTGSYCAGLH